MRAKELLGLCEGCYTSFNPNVTTEDSHVEAFLRENKILDGRERVFIQQAVYGCVRYRALMEVIISAYLRICHRMKSNFNKYLLVGYLALLRLGELSMHDFRRLLSGMLTASNNAEYLRFIFNLENVQEHFMKGWLQLYDEEWIQDNLIDHIKQFHDEIHELAEDMEDFVEARKKKAQGVKETKQTTVVQPFKNLTKPRPRLLPEPEVLPTYERPVRPKDMSTLEAQAAIQAFKVGKKISTVSAEVAQQNRIAEQESVRKSRAPKLTVRPSKLETIQQQVEQDIQRSMVPEFSTFKSPEEVRRELELAEKKAPVVKTTNTVILREDAFYKKQEEEELRQLRKKEDALRSSTDFKEWQQAMAAQDEIEKNAKIARRKVEMQITDENAKEAKRQQIEDNKHYARQYREIHTQLLDRNKQEEEEKLLEKQQHCIDQERQLKDHVQAAKSALVETRKTGAAAVKKESQQNEIRLAQLMELERQKRQEIIKEIRAMEKSRPNHGVYKADFDPNAKVGNGMLNEMSLAELREELKKVRAEKAAEEQAVRTRIANDKVNAATLNEQRLQHITQNRELVRQTRMIQREERRAEEARRKEIQRQKEEVEIQDLQQKLARRRQEKQEAETERKRMEKERKIKAQLLSADKAAIEFKKWEEMEKGKQTIAGTVQKIKQVEDTTKAQVHRLKQLELHRDMRRAKRALWSIRKEADSNLNVTKTAAKDQTETEQYLLEMSVSSEKSRKQKVIQHKLNSIGHQREAASRALTA
eukprot:TRINITY_DN84836_c0_g1_i1.p1 TRINITY_DN84836_c0_g1~~TRINITY_DN84836_c0_g1_i1.p1  ORF type:complete len:759 (-),score=123.71 TRINITY_DN84836_c0_g1_i1:85-2361(-)